MREEAGLRKCKARGGEEMGLSAGFQWIQFSVGEGIDSARLEI